MPFTTKTESRIINDILLSILQTTSVSDANVGSILRQNVEAISQEISALYTELQNIYDSTRISTATGDELDELGLLVGRSRNAGVVASSLITFLRTAPAGSNFSITTSEVVSTQPNTGDEQLKYTVNSSVVFQSSISGEQHYFVDGNYNYKLNERFVANTSSVEITGYTTSTSLVYSFTNGVDFGVTRYDDFLVKVGTITEVDDCDSVSGWSGSADATTIATSLTYYKENSAALSLGKSGTSTNQAYYDKTLGSSVSGKNKWFVAYVRFDSTTVKNKIDSIEISLGTGGSIANSYKFTLENADFVSGNWGRYRFRYNDSSTEVSGSPDISSINYIRFNIVTNNTTDTLSSGDVIIDYFIFSETESYEGDVIEWLETTSPLTETTFTITSYSPLSKEVPVSANSAGSKYNVNTDKINFKVTTIPNINSVNNYVSVTNGVDEESDSDYRERIKTAAQAAGKATAESIRQAALGISGVTSALIDDLPLEQATSESHTYTSGTSTYALDFEVVNTDSTSTSWIFVRGTASGTDYTFLYGTDFTLINNSDSVNISTIQFQGGGTSPDNGTTFLVDYYYNWLGHAYLYVASAEGTPSDTILSLVTSEVEVTKAAGVQVHTFGVDIVYQAVTASVKPLTDYTFAQISDSVEDAITGFLNTLEVGNDVYVAKLYDIIMDVEGVENVNITVPSSDTTVSTSEIIRAGTITLTELS